MKQKLNSEELQKESELATALYWFNWLTYILLPPQKAKLLKEVTELLEKQTLGQSFEATKENKQK